MKHFAVTFVWTVKCFWLALKWAFKDFVYWMSGDYFDDKELYDFMMKVNEMFYSAPVKIPDYAWEKCNQMNAEWNAYCDFMGS